MRGDLIMNLKAKSKLLVDVLMTICLFMLEGFQFFEQIEHEVIGTCILVLFLLHHLLNFNWHKNIFKGKYTVLRTCNLMIDIGVCVTMIIQIVSGILMSYHVFQFIPFHGSMSLVRRCHILGAYWGFIFMGLHLGMHWGMMLNQFRKVLPMKLSKKYSFFPFIGACLIACYGMVVFVQRDFLTYMLLKSEFVFMDFSESPFLFYLDYCALMGLFIFAAYYGCKYYQSYKRQKTISNTFHTPFKIVHPILDKTRTFLFCFHYM